MKIHLRRSRKDVLGTEKKEFYGTVCFFAGTNKESSTSVRDQGKDVSLCGLLVR